MLQSHQSSLTCLLCLLETNRCGRKGAIHRWGCGKAQHVRHPLHPQCFELLANLQLAQKIFQGMDSPIASSQSRWNCCNKARSELALITLVLDGFGVKENLGIDICSHASATCSMSSKTQALSYLAEHAQNDILGSLIHARFVPVTAFAL